MSKESSRISRNDISRGSASSLSHGAARNVRGARVAVSNQDLMIVLGIYGPSPQISLGEFRGSAVRRRLQAATRFIGGFLNNCLPRVSGVHTGRRSGLDSPHQGTTSERIGLEIKPTAEPHRQFRTRSSGWTPHTAVSAARR